MGGEERKKEKQIRNRRKTRTPPLRLGDFMR